MQTLPSVARAEVSGARGCADCPFASFPKAKAPERAAFDAGAQTAAADAPPSPSSYVWAVAGLIRPRAQAPPVSPPLRLLPTLRI